MLTYATQQMEGLEELHNNIIFYLPIILFAVSWIMLSIILNYRKAKISKYVKHGTLIQLYWTGKFWFITITTQKYKRKFRCNANQLPKTLKDNLDKAITPGPVLSLLFMKAANGELNANETNFLRGIRDTSRYENFLDLTLNHANTFNTSNMELRDFYAQFILLVERTTGHSMDNYDGLHLQADSALWMSSAYQRFFHITYYSNDPDYRTVSHFLLQSDFKYTRLRAIETNIDTLTYNYFKLWSKNFSLTSEEINNIYTAYQRCLDSRLPRDLAYFDFKLDATGKLEHFLSQVYYHPTTVHIPNMYTFKYHEILDQSTISTLMSEKYQYLRWISESDCKRIIKQLLQGQEPLYRRLNLRSIDFTTVTETRFPHLFQYQDSLLSAQEVDTIINSLATAGIIST